MERTQEKRCLRARGAAADYCNLPEFAQTYSTPAGGFSLTGREADLAASSQPSFVGKVPTCTMLMPPVTNTIKNSLNKRASCLRPDALKH